MKKILIVGGGGIGERHVRCFLKTGRCIVSVCDTRTQRLNELRKRYDIEKTYLNFDDVNLTAFDAVVVCVPANLHVAMSKKVLGAGAHLLCEKPLGTSMNGVEELIELAEKSGSVAGVAFTRRHIPDHEELRRIAMDGEIGEVKMITVIGGQHFPKYRPDYKEIYYAKPEMGGGAIIDIMGHYVNYLEWILGEESEVACFYDNLVLDTKDVEDSVLMSLRYKQGPMATISINQFQFDDFELVEIAGTKGSARLHQKVIRLNPRTWETTISICKGIEANWEEKGFPHQERDLAYIRQADHFLDAVEGSCRVRSTLREGAQALKVCLLARKSYDEKKIFRTDASVS